MTRDPNINDFNLFLSVIKCMTFNVRLHYKGEKAQAIYTSRVPVKTTIPVHHIHPLKIKMAARKVSQW